MTAAWNPLGNAILQAARLHSARIALDDGSRQLTFVEVGEEIRGLVGALDRFPPDSVVALISANRVEYVVSDLAATVGAFVRLDDLQKGYALGQLDRSIIMSPSKVNARVVLPVTTLDDVLHGYPVDFLLYANNHEAVDATHPVVERLSDEAAALAVFRDGAAMSKGTTTAVGVTHSYFANPFGPAQRRGQHEALAASIFAAAFRAGVFVGQLRTQLGLPGRESAGPRAAAEALLDLIAAKGARPS